jgi:hypothetical protein
MKLHSRKRVAGREIDSVKKRQTTYGRENPALLARCYTAWSNLSQFREERDRVLRYVYGDQWSDYIDGPDGHPITEKEYIRSKGNIPLVNNVMRPLLNAVTGIYANQDTEPVCYARNREDQAAGDMMSTALQCNWQINRMSDLLVTAIEEYCQSGCGCTRETYEYRDDVLDSYTDLVNPYFLAWEGGSDPRQTDLTMIMQIHDIDWGSMLSTFCTESSGLQVSELEQYYRGGEGGSGHYLEEDNPSMSQLNEKFNIRNVSFYTPADRSKYRVYEVWTKEVKQRYRCWDVNTGERYKIELEDLDTILRTNSARQSMAAQYGIAPDDVPEIRYEQVIDSYWYYQYLTPSGHVLLEGESPYYHRSHPYTLKLYPFVNGEIHSFASTFIDQQRYINRLNIINDFMMRTSAKGVWLVPKSCIPDGMTNEEFYREATSFDGMIVFNDKVGRPDLKPNVLFSNATNIGISEMLQMQLNLIDRISNVQGALQGRTPAAGTSASRYAQETQNATTSLAALLKKFTTFTEDIAKKKVKMMQQFYEDGRYISVGANDKNKITRYDANSVRDVEYFVSIKDSVSSPVYQMRVNDWITNLWQQSGGALDVRDVLRYGNFPFGDKLLQDLETRQQQMQQGTAPDAQQGLGQQYASQIGADQTKVAQAQQLLGGNF